MFHATFRSHLPGVKQSGLLYLWRRDEMRNELNFIHYASPFLTVLCKIVLISDMLVLTIASVPMACNLLAWTCYTKWLIQPKRNSLHDTPWKTMTNKVSPSDYTAIYDYPSVCCLDSAHVDVFKNYVYLTSLKKLWLPCIVETMEEIHVCGKNVGGSSLNISFPVPSAWKPRSGVTKTKMGRYALEDLQVDENGWWWFPQHSLYHGQLQIGSPISWSHFKSKTSRNWRYQVFGLCYTL